MSEDPFQGLYALKLVAEKRNFTAAAQELGVSASAISQAIKQLEQKLGVTLLARTTRNTNLTEAGRIFLNQAGPAMDQILGAIEDIQIYSQRPSGTLRINLPRQIFSGFFARTLQEFSSRFPEITVDLFFEDSQTNLVEQGFDAGIRLSDILALDMIAIRLFGPVRFVTAASPQYLKIRGIPRHPADLLHHDCIRPRFHSGSIYDRWEFTAKNGQDVEVQVQGTQILNDSLLMLRAAKAGSGIVYTTEAAIQDDLDSGELSLILEEYAPVSDGFYLYYPSSSQVLPKLRAFIDHFKVAARHWNSQA